MNERLKIINSNSSEFGKYVVQISKIEKTSAYLGEKLKKILISSFLLALVWWWILYELGFLLTLLFQTGAHVFSISATLLVQNEQ